MRYGVWDMDEVKLHDNLTVRLLIRQDFYVDEVGCRIPST